MYPENTPNLTYPYHSRLSVETHNSDWSSTVLDVDPRAMDGLDQLRSLSLASNNLWSLPKEFFCQVRS